MVGMGPFGTAQASGTHTREYKGMCSLSGCMHALAKDGRAVGSDGFSSTVLACSLPKFSLKCSAAINNLNNGMLL